MQLLAPLNWNLLRFDLFWPESMGTYVLMAAGLLYFIFNIKQSIQPNCDEFIISKKSLGLSGVLFLAWLVLPFAYIQSVYAADNHFIHTLKCFQNRVGKNIEIDRNSISKNDGVVTLKTSYGESISLDNVQAEEGALISLQSKFTSNSNIYVENYHLHSRFRNYASMIGLAGVLLIWLIFIARCYVIKPKGK